MHIEKHDPKDLPDTLSALGLLLDEHGVGDYIKKAAAITCDGCGHQVAASPIDRLEEYTKDWHLEEGNDLCPRCKLISQ